MNIEKNSIQNLSLFTPVRLFIIIVFLLALFFRFYNLDYKVYWDDEVYTSLRVAGFTETELVKEFSSHQISKVADIQKYLQFNSNNNIIDTIMGLAKEEPQHPPLYFIISHYWVKIFGYSVGGIRSLSAVASLLSLPAIYWLCLELFGYSIFGYVAMLILAVSPFHVLYSQEAREYSLWTLMILLMSASFLRAVRLKGTLNWAGYTGLLTLGLYIYPLSGFVAIGHGLYLLVLQGFRLKKIVISYLISVSLGFLFFSPWLLVTFLNTNQIGKGMSFIRYYSLSPLDIFKVLIGSIKFVFIDDSLHSPALIGAILILVGYSIYYLYRKTPIRVWLFLATLSLFAIIPTVIPDLMDRGGRTTQYRYLISLYLAIELALVYLLASQISGTSTRLWLKRFWQAILLAVVSMGIFSCIISSQAETAWIKLGPSGSFPALARIINQTPNSLIISDNYIIYSAALSYRLDPRVSLNVAPRCYLCTLSTPSLINPKLLKIPDDFTNIFLLLPSQQLKDEFGNNYKLTRLDKSVSIWQVQRSL